MKLLSLLAIAASLQAVPISRTFTFTQWTNVELDEPNPLQFAIETGSFTFSADFSTITDATPLTVDNFSACTWSPGCASAEVENGSAPPAGITLLNAPPQSSQGMTVWLNGGLPLIFPSIDAQFLAYVTPAIEIQTYYAYGLTQFGYEAGLWQMDVAAGAADPPATAPEPASLLLVGGLLSWASRRRLRFRLQKSPALPLDGRTS